MFSILARYRSVSSVGLFAVAALASPVAVSAQVNFVPLHSFVSATEGHGLLSSVFQATDGNFYGTTQFGGASDLGTIFKMTPDGTVTVLHTFTGGTDGSGPQGGVIQASDGLFYGTTASGGTPDLGTVFRMTLDGTVTVLHEFQGDNDGAHPCSPLIQGRDGNFYGTTEFSDTNDGTVFKMTAAGTVTTLRAFSGGQDGAFPVSALMIASDGNFYGVTSGVDPLPGAVFRMTPAGNVVVLHVFTGGADDGEAPIGSLVQGADGAIYGSTAFGGASNHGTIFRMTLSGTLSVVYSFAGGDDGARPDGGLMRGTDGNFYGTTSEGGPSGVGTVFIVTPAGVRFLHAFQGTDGAAPVSALTQGADGNLYGTTYNGGDTDGGVVFRLDTHLCRDTLTLTYAAQTLSLNFTLQNSVASTWSTFVLSSAGVAPLWSVAIPAIPSITSFTVPIHGVPPVGVVGVFTAFSTSHGIMCSDFQVVDTNVASLPGK